MKPVVYHKINKSSTAKQDKIDFTAHATCHLIKLALNPLQKQSYFALQLSVYNLCTVTLPGYKLVTISWSYPGNLFQSIIK